MELLQLKYFQAVARLEHMTKAAKELNVSQPSLSNTISRLEKNLGVPLFVRQGRHIRLTTFGKVFLQRVDRIFHELEEGERQVKEMAGLDGGRITVSMVLPSNILPVFIEEFLKQHPRVRIKQLIASSARMMSQLENAEVDLCISTCPITGPEIEWIPLMEEEIFLSVPKSHPLAGRESIALREAANETFISSVSGYGFRDITDQFCIQAGFTPHTPFEFEETGTILRLVEMGMGVSFTPSLSLRQPLPAVVHLRIHDPVCTRTIGIAWNRNHYMSQAAELFCQHAIHFFSSETWLHKDNK